MEPEGQDDVSAPLKLDLDVLAALVAIALVAAVVAEFTTGVPSSTRRPGGDDASAGMTAALASAEVELEPHQLGIGGAPCSVTRSAALRRRALRRIGADPKARALASGSAELRITWATICREVTKLRVGILGGEVLPLATNFATTELKAANRWRNVVTPLGLEPRRRAATWRRKTATSHDLKWLPGHRVPVHPGWSRLISAFWATVASRSCRGTAALAMSLAGCAPPAGSQRP